MSSQTYLFKKVVDVPPSLLFFPYAASGSREEFSRAQFMYPRDNDSGQPAVDA